MIALAPWLLTGGALAAWAHVTIRARGRIELTLRASHEARGPLTAAMLALHLARRSGGERGAALLSVDRELRRAARALDDVDAAGRGRAPVDRRRPVRTGPLLSAQAETWRPVARSVGADLRLAEGSADVEVTGDPDRLAQATANLIANALEHGGGVVTIGARTDGDRVRIEVKDDGAGLVAPGGGVRAGLGAAGGRSARGRAWRRAPAAAGPSSRRGRGLAIVADIAARHGGRLLAVSERGGTRVAVELPRPKTMS